ncbi:MAG: hypothetical protein U0003_00875 [Vampirovibrionales bacterium]
MIDDPRNFQRGSSPLNEAESPDGAINRLLRQQLWLERVNRGLLGAVLVGFFITMLSYGWVVHQKYTMQQLIQSTQTLQESNTALSIQLNRLQSFTGIMHQAQASQWLEEPSDTVTVMASVGQPLPTVASQDRVKRPDQWPVVTGY